MGESLSTPIDASQRVRQGCILSPVLFNIFISDLPGILDDIFPEPAKLGNDKCLSSILWADDLLMISESKDGIRKMIQKLVKYSEENGLKINEDKTKCMINKNGRHIRCNIKCHNLSVTSVREYKYLRFLVIPSGETSSGIKDLRSRELYAVVQLRKKMGENLRQNLSIPF